MAFPQGTAAAKSVASAAHARPRRFVSARFLLLGLERALIAPFFSQFAPQCGTPDRGAKVRFDVLESGGVIGEHGVERIGEVPATSWIPQFKASRLVVFVSSESL